MFEVLANAQAAIATARQEDRLRRGDQEEAKGPQPAGQPDIQPPGGQQVMDDDVQYLYSSSESQAPSNKAPRRQSKKRRQPPSPVPGSIGDPMIIPQEVQAVRGLPSDD